MLKLPPPIWALVYILIAAAISWALGWPKLLGLPLASLGIALVAVALIPPVWAIVLFRREGTEVNPTSPANRKLVTSGPYRFTRNPMYLGLVILTLGIAVWVGAWPMFIAPIAVFATANWVHIPFEEDKMRRQFGATYDGYVRRVRRWVERWLSIFAELCPRARRTKGPEARKLRSPVPRSRGRGVTATPRNADRRALEAGAHHHRPAGALN
jgi:protein-S-isoprenylcysteine O-methyltransferase Ste14